MKEINRRTIFLAAVQACLDRIIRIANRYDVDPYKLADRTHSIVEEKYDPVRGELAAFVPGVAERLARRWSSRSRAQTRHRETLLRRARELNEAADPEGGALLPSTVSTLRPYLPRPALIPSASRSSEGATDVADRTIAWILNVEGRPPGDVDRAARRFLDLSKGALHFRSTAMFDVMTAATRAETRRTADIAFFYGLGPIWGLNHRGAAGAQAHVGDLERRKKRRVAWFSFADRNRLYEAGNLEFMLRWPLPVGNAQASSGHGLDVTLLRMIAGSGLRGIFAFGAYDLAQSTQSIFIFEELAGRWELSRHVLFSSGATGPSFDTPFDVLDVPLSKDGALANVDGLRRRPLRDLRALLEAQTALKKRARSCSRSFVGYDDLAQLIISARSRDELLNGVDGRLGISLPRG